MTPKEAADQIRPTFHLDAVPPEDRHHVLFVESVAAELGVEATPYNLHQVAGALDAAGIHGDAPQYPLMMYSRQHHAIKDVAASTYYPRHDFVFAMVNSAEEANKLGDGWVEDIAKLPPRGDTPINAPEPVAVEEPAAPEVEAEAAVNVLDPPSAAPEAQAAEAESGVHSAPSLEQLKAEQAVAEDSIPT